MGRTDDALQLARKLEEAFEDTYVVPEFIAEVYGACGEKDRAFFGSDAVWKRIHQWLYLSASGRASKRFKTILGFRRT